MKLGGLDILPVGHFFRGWRQGPFGPYAIAVITTLIAVLIRWALLPVIGYHLPFATFLASVLIAAWFGRWQAGALAIVLGATAGYFFVTENLSDVLFGGRQLYGLVPFTVVAALGTAVIEAQHRATASLAQSEDFLSFALMTARTGAWDLNLVDHTAHRSLQHDQIFGYDKLLPRWTYEMFLEHVIPEDREAVDRKFRDALETQSDWGFECRIVRRDGKIRWIWAAGRHRLDHGQRRMAGIVQDITDRKIAEEALRESELRFRTMADAIPQLAWIAQPDGYIYWYNRRWYEYTGTTPEHMEGWGWQSVHDPATLPDVVERWKASIATGQPLEMEFPLRGSDGHFRRFLTRVLPVKDEDGRVLQWFGTNTDITELVETEEALREADRQKTQFLAMLSHELRNPLAPIQNSLYILARVASGSEQAKRAQAVIDRQVSHLTRLVDDLLDVTRIARGKIQLQRERVDLGEVVRRAAEDHRVSFANIGVAFTITAPDRPLWIEGDRTRVAQIVGNLLANAAKFTEPGGEAHLSLHEDKNLRQAVICVRDTGAGIAPDLLPKLFEPFTQADTTLGRSKGGLGLGLALVKRLVDMHGGTVSVHSDGVGQGATFTVCLPLATAQPAAAAPVHSASLGNPRHVLIIEDNVDAAESLRTALELGGHTVEVALSGADGIAKARTFGPEVVLCDIGLPDMEGYEVARAMRADPGLCELRLIALTGYAAPEDSVKASHAGFDAHLAKPPNMDKLNELLES